MKTFRLLLLVLTGWFLLPAPAYADPASIAIFVATSLPFVSAAVDTFVFFAVQAAVYAGYSWAASKLSGMGQRPQSAQERQASVTQMQVGESDREFIVGEVATAGQLLDAYNYGGKYGTDNEVLVIALADHKCEDLLGYYIGDAYYPFSNDGFQSGFSGQLSIHWHNGTKDQGADYTLTSTSDRWSSDDRLSGVAYVVVIYTADNPKATTPVWSTGRPSFLWHLKGARLYDPRKDSTVAGGSGSHRWSDPQTWEWSDNPILARYAYNRGIYYGDQVDTPAALMIGRGLSAIEAPPERVIAYANICDEMVALKAGGSEKRYRANGVIRAGETFIAVEEMFASTCGGIIIQREGGIEVEPGVAKSAVATITDGALLIGEPIHVENYASANDRVNTVAAQYVEPDQIWRSTAAPVRRSVGDIIADGGPMAKSLSLVLVTSQTQAQRVGEIERRLSRKERHISMVLGPRYSYLEEGDWINFQSARYFDGATITFRIEAVNIGAGYRTSLILREISASVYAWTASSDEGTPGQGPIEEPATPDPLTIEDPVVTAVSLVGSGSDVLPAVHASWTTPVGPNVLAVQVELRAHPGAEVIHATQSFPDLGYIILSNGVPSQAEMQARIVPIGYDGREVEASDWIDIITPNMAVSQTVTDVENVGDFTSRAVSDNLKWALESIKKLTLANLETFASLSELRQSQFQPILVNGRPVSTVVIEEITNRIDGDNYVLGKLEVIGQVTPDGQAFTLNENKIIGADGNSFAYFRNAIFAGLSDNYSAIQSEITARTTAISSLASTLSTVQANLATAQAAITAEITARADADGAFTSSLGALTARVGTAEGAITSEATARAGGDSALTSSLNALTSRVGTAEGAITSEATARTTAISALAATLTTVQATLADAQAAITAEVTARANADSAIVSSANTLAARVGTAEGAITAEAAARVSADAAIVSTANTLTARVGTAEAAISSEATTRATAISALSATLSTVQASLATAQAAITTETAARVSALDALAATVTTVQASVAAAEAAITSEATARATADSATATSLSSLVTSINGVSASVTSEAAARATAIDAIAAQITSIQATLGTAQAAITSEATTRASADGAFATSLSTLTSSYNGLTASVSTLSSSVNGIAAQWVLLVDSGGHIAGIKAAAGSTTSELIFLAEAIKFYNAAGAAIAPFSIEDGIVKATNFEADRIKANTITATEILSDSIIKTSRFTLGSAVSVTSGSEVDIFSQSVTVSGGQIDIDVFLNLSGNVAGGTSMGVIHRLYRGGSLLETFGHYMLAGKAYNSTGLSFREKPGAGTHTYKVTSQRDNSAGYFDVTRLSLTIRDNKTQA